MLSPDEKHYAHEGQWYPILQTPSKTEESNPNFVTKDELHVRIANFLSILLLFLGSYALYELLTRSNEEGIDSLLQIIFATLPDHDEMEIIFGWSIPLFAIGTISAMFCVVSLLYSRTGKIDIRATRITSMISGLVFLFPYVLCLVYYPTRYLTGSFAYGFISLRYLNSSYGSLAPFFAGVIGVMLHIYCRRKLS